MPRKRLPTRKTTEVLRLHAAGMSAREIARAVAVVRSTVAEHLRRADTAEVCWPLLEGLDEEALEALLFPKLQPTADRPVSDWAAVHKQVRSRRHHVTLRLLWLEWREQHLDGFGYSQFCEHYRRFVATLDVVMRLAYAPGERMFVDLSGDKATWCDPETGEVHEADVLVAVLGPSGMCYVEATRGQDLLSFVGAHVHAFSAFGGVSEITVPDNLKAGVTTACFYEPELNPTYGECATHYGTIVLPTRVRRPRDKALSSHCTSWVVCGHRYCELARRRCDVAVRGAHLSTARSGPTSSSRAVGASHSGQQPPMPTRRANVPHSQRCSPSALVPELPHS